MLAYLNLPKHKMNDVQRSVLQRHFRQLSNDLILTDDLLGAMYQRKIFERNMIEIIKSEKTESEQVVRMLELLPKRGPDAFDSFVEIITENYPWLAAMLESSCKQESMKYSVRVESYKSETFTDRADSSVRFSDGFLESEPDIKTKVLSFVHKQFGHSKRISENDKKAMFRWMSSQLQMERKRNLNSASSRRSSIVPSPIMVDVGVNTDLINAEKSDFDMGQVQQRIKRIYEKIQQIKSTAKNENHLTTKIANGINSKPRTPNGVGRPHLTPANLDNVISELDTMVERIEKLEDEVNKCHVMLNDKDKKLSLSLHIYDLSLTIKQKDQELKQDKQKSEKMLNELYDFSKKVHLLEQTKISQKSTIDNHIEEIEKLKGEKEKISNQLSHFEKQSIMHSEKQKTLENLKSMVRDLQSTRDNIQPSHRDYNSMGRRNNNSHMSPDSHSSVRKSNGIMGKSIQPTPSSTRPSMSRRGALDETSQSTSPTRRYTNTKSLQYKRKTSNSIYKV